MNNRALIPLLLLMILLFSACGKKEQYLPEAQNDEIFTVIP